MTCAEYCMRFSSRCMKCFRVIPSGRLCHLCAQKQFERTRPRFEFEMPRVELPVLKLPRLYKPEPKCTCGRTFGCHAIYCPKFWGSLPRGVMT